MKLHLPSKLRNALLACMTAMVGITTTCATGALMLSQAQAEDTFWNGANDNEHNAATTVVPNGDRLIINGWKDGNPLGEASGAGNGAYNESYKLGTITVQDGGQLWLNIHSQKASTGGNFKQLAGAVTLSGHDFSGEFVDGSGNPEQLRAKAALVLYDGSYLFQDQMNIDGYAYLMSWWGGHQTFTNLTSVSDNHSDVLVLQTNITENVAVNYTLNYNKNKAKESPSFKAFDGTIIVRDPFDDKNVNDNPREYANLVITSQDVVGSGVTYRLEGNQTALHLAAANLYIPNVEVGKRAPIVRSKTSGPQVRQTIGHLHMDEAAAVLRSDGGSVVWTINSLTNSGNPFSLTTEMVTLHNGTESYKPNILYLNTSNKTVTDAAGNVIKQGFTGELWLSDAYTTTPTEKYGVFQDYVEIGHPDALAEATLLLRGDSASFTFRGDDEVLTNDHDYSLENYPILAINTTDANIGGLNGTYLGLIMSGTAPIDGTEDNPSTAIAPTSSAATVTLHVGAIGESDNVYSFAGEILKNVNIDKQGLGKQIIYNLENDPARYINVTSGVLELGSVGDFRRLSVASGGRAEVGLSVSSEINTWGKQHQFVYFEATDNGIDLSDVTKISGNVVLTDKLYCRDNREDAADDTITVLYLNPQRYFGDSVTLVDADLAVFDPVTGNAADLSRIKTITVTEGSSLVSASPDHHGVMFDPNIVVEADIVMQGNLNFMAYGSLVPSQYVGGELTFRQYNTTYTGKITSKPYKFISTSGTTFEESTSFIYKNGFGTVTLAGDMSEYRGYLSVHDGTLVLSGSHGKEKNFSAIDMVGEGKAHLEISNGADVSTSDFVISSYAWLAREHCETSMTVGQGATFTITGENTRLDDEANNKLSEWESATILLGSGSHADIQVNGTLNMTRASYISVTELKTEHNEVTRKEIHVNDGGVFNAKGLWLQSYSSSPDITSTVHVHTGGVLNLGSEGIGHADVSGGGAVKASTDNHLIVNFDDGATLGIINDAESWTTQRALRFDGLVKVNTQGFVVEQGSTENGSAKMITLGSVQTVKEGAGVVKLGTGTLALGGGSNVDQAIVKNGYLSVAKIDNKYAVTMGDVKTETNGSLLFDLTDAVAVNQTSAVGQAHVVITGEVDGKLNVTVRAGETDYNGNRVDMNGKTYGIISTAPPAASNVNLIAMVDDGWTAEYFVNSNTGWGYVTINNTGETLGNDVLLTWASADGESNFWGNSTEKNFMADDSTETRRFTNNSAVTFSQPGETITILDTVRVTDKEIDGTEHAAMTVAQSGYEFTGTGNIVGVGGTLKVEDGVHVTFSNTGGVYFENGVTLGEGATLRLEYLDDTSSNWDALVTGEGALEIAAGGVRTNVLSSVMGDKVTTVSLDNNTTIELTYNNPYEAAKLAAADKVVVKSGSRILLSTRTTTTLMEEGDTLQLVGKGIASEQQGDYSTEAAMSVTGLTNARVDADVELLGDTTLYIEGGSVLTFSGAYTSNGCTLTLAGETASSQGYYGALILESPDSSLMAGDIKMGVGSKLGFRLDGANNTITNDISMNNSSLIAYTDTIMDGNLTVQGESDILVQDGATLKIDSAVVGDDEAVLTLSSKFGSTQPGVVELVTDNSGYDGSWVVMPGHVLLANHTNALKNATVAGTTDMRTELHLGEAADYYYADGVNDTLDIVAVNDTMKTLELNGNDVYESHGQIGKNVSLVMNGNGSQSFVSGDSFADDYNGCITVKDGMLAFRNAPTSYDTIELAGDEATLGIGYYDYDTPGKFGIYVAHDLGVTTGQTLLVTQTGAMLNGNLAPTSGGQITLGTEDKTWAAKGGLNLYGQALKLDTSDLAALTVNLSPFLKEGDYVELFTHVGEFSVDGKTLTIDDELGFLENYFVCDDINLARAQLELTASGTLRIKLINDSDGIYYEYQGGGAWNNDAANKIWSTKDEQDAAYSYVSGAAAYFTNDQNETVSVTDDIVAREMAVKNGSYIFDLTEGNDLTITDRYYEMEGGVATFQLKATETTDAAGNSVSDGAVLTVDAGMGDITNTVVQGDGNTANRLILGGTTDLSGNARFEDVDLFMDGENSRLNLGTTTDTELQALGGEGTITADGGELTISNVKDGVFVGSLVAADPDNITPGANTLTIGAGDASKKQIFSDVTMDESWDLVNNGVLDLKPTDDSKLNSLTLGTDSVTTLTVNTDKDQLLGLTQLIVEDGAKLTLNSTGNAPIMSGSGTPGTSYTVLGSFADDEQLDLAGGDGSLEIEIGTGSAFLMVDKTKPITLEAVYNDSTGYYDLVMKATVDDTNQFTPLVEGEPNATAGADMLWSAESMEHMAAEPDGDMAQAFNAVANMVTSANVDKGAISKALAAVAGSSTAVLGSAFSADVERQLRAIRNRTTTMGVNQCEVNENMPYYNAWINAEGNHRELDADGLAAGYTHDSWGGTVGFDVDVTPSVTMGLALTAMYGDIESDGPDKADGDFDTMYLSAFARYARNAWVHTFVATVGRADVTLDRTVNVGGYSYKTTGDTDGMAFGFMYEVGRVFAANEDGTTCWQPVFNVALRNSSISGYEEKGSDAALSVGDQDFTTITFGLGARMQTIMGENLYNRTSIFEARALLKFDVGDTEAETTTAMINGNGKAHAIEGAEVGEIGVELGAGVTIPVGAEGGSIFVDASAELRSGYTNINGTVGYRVNF